jgi:hypothetical protein
VCQSFRSKFPSYEVIRHARNIGFGANYLRALELSRGLYTGVVCDDDALLLSNAESFLSLLNKAEYDFFSVGGPRQEEWPKGIRLSPSFIQTRYGTFLTNQSFVPSLVIRTALLNSKLFLDGYFSIATNFPQLTLGKHLLSKDIPFWVPEYPLVRREVPAEKSQIYLDVIAGWAVVCRGLPRQDQRIQAFYSIFTQPHAFGMIREIIRMIIWCKLDTGGNSTQDISRILRNVDGIIKPPLWLCWGATLIPAGLYRATRSIYRKAKYGWLRQPLPPTFHTPVSSDELRR